MYLSLEIGFISSQFVFPSVFITKRLFPKVNYYFIMGFFPSGIFISKGKFSTEWVHPTNRFIGWDLNTHLLVPMIFLEEENSDKELKLLYTIIEFLPFGFCVYIKIHLILAAYLPTFFKLSV